MLICIFLGKVLITFFRVSQKIHNPQEVRNQNTMPGAVCGQMQVLPSFLFPAQALTQRSLPGC